MATPAPSLDSLSGIEHSPQATRSSLQCRCASLVVREELPARLSLGKRYLDGVLAAHAWLLQQKMPSDTVLQSSEGKMSNLGEFSRPSQVQQGLTCVCLPA